MKRGMQIFIGAVFFVLIFSAPAGAARSAEQAPFIPMPVSYEPLPGRFDLKSSTDMVIPENSDQSWMKAARIFARKLKQRFRVSLDIKIAGRGASGKNGGIFIRRVPAEKLQGEEGYQMEATESVLIRVSTSHGLHNALMTVLWMIDPSSASTPACRIIDYPRFAWRGIMLDTSRTFIPPDKIMQYIDLASELKVNVMHLHLTDDQGWRLESKVFPGLHRTGGVLEPLSERKLDALDDHGWGRGNRGYYTRDEVREIISFAGERHVMVVPEIDVPGHSSAMLAAYPDLSCSGEGAPVRRDLVFIPWIYRSALCPGKEEVYEFLDKLLAEVASLFPAPYVHLGGDEVAASDWLDYPPNRELMQEHGLSGLAGLQSYFMERADEILARHGKTMIAWDETTDYAPKGSVVQAWRKRKFAREAAERGNDTIVSLFTPHYVNYPFFIHTMKAIYSFQHAPAGLSPGLSDRVLGGEACLWGVQPDMDNIDRKLFPRVIANAEALWSHPGQKDWESFLERLDRVEEGFSKRGVEFGNTWARMFSMSR